MVTPTRLVFEKQKRSAELTLTNNGKEASTYRIQTVNSRMTETGERENIEGEPQKGELFADKLVRFAPRQIRLKPGEQQTIRVMARIPNRLNDGEYRTGLSFQWIPEPGDPQISKDSQEADDISVRLEFSFGVTIPVIIRHGGLSATGKIVKTNVKTTEKGKFLEVRVSREGNQSLYGDLSVYFVNADGKEYLIKTIGGVAIYVPNPHRIFSMLLPEDLPTGKGTGKERLRVEYRERKESGGKLIADSIISFE